MTYKGGKGADGVYHKIINQIPPHDEFIDAFYGGGSISKYLRLCRVRVAIDLDSSVLASVSPGTVAICGDAISYLNGRQQAGNLCPDVFVYADPPYLKRDIDGRPVRSWQGDIYKHEFATVEEHTRLLNCLLSLSCMVAVSGYWSDLYGDMLSSWRAVSYMVGVQGGQAREEWLWMNYPEPQALHDYRYLGSNFREREKINRQRRRWRARLERMSPLQRYALLSSIAELNEPAGKSEVSTD